MAFVTRRVQKIGVLGITPEERMETIMRRYIAPILIALVAAAPGAAFAASAVTPAAKPGMVKAFDLKAHTLTLADGKTYQLPATFKDPGLKAGEKVTVHWKMNGTAYEATSVTIG
jgi:zona occludens toxin (predicted ATPase)